MRYRYQIAAQEAPTALLWLALLILGLSVVDAALRGFQPRVGDGLHIAVVLVFVFGWWLTSRPDFPAAIVPWVNAIAALSVVASLELEVLLDPTALGLAYVLMAMITFGPLTLDYRAFAAAAAVMLVGFLLTVAQSAEFELLGWGPAAVAALGLGAFLLHIRIRGIDALGRARARLETMALRDPLTGVVNRNGIEDRLPELASLADRHLESLFVAFVDVDGLKQANDVHGHDFGDEVLVGVAHAIRSTARAGDLIGRWGGDEFIVVGIGHPPDASDLEERIVSAQRRSDVDVTRWNPSVSVGVASLMPPGLDFDRLVARADASMYERRRARRVDTPRNPEGP